MRKAAGSVSCWDRGRPTMLNHPPHHHANEDRRFFSIHLTSKGEELAKLHDDIHKNYAEIFKNALDKKELKILEGLLEKVLIEV